MNPPRLAIVNRGSIRLPAGDPFDAPLPGSEVVALNIARAFADLGVPVSYYGTADASTRIPGVTVLDTARLLELPDNPDLCLLWIRDYVLPWSVFDWFARARHVLLSEDSVRDMSAILRRSTVEVGRRVRGYLNRFDAVVFASKWHLDDWRAGFGIDAGNAVVIYNLASHVPWRIHRPDAASGAVLHTSHPRKSLPAVTAVAARLAPHGYSVDCSGDPSLYQDASCRIIRPSANGRWVDLGSFAEYAARNAELVRFRPPVAINAMADLLDGFDLLLHPDYTGETGATTVVEALRRGLVPVVSDLGALPELVGDAGVVVPGPSWTEDFADRCATAVRAVSDGDRWRMWAARARVRPRIDTGPVVRAWSDVLAVPVAATDVMVSEEQSC